MRYDIKQGDVYLDGATCRRVVYVGWQARAPYLEQPGRQHWVTYSKGGDRLYTILRSSFVAWLRRGSIDVTGCEIETEQKDLAS